MHQKYTRTLKIIEVSFLNEWYHIEDQQYWIEKLNVKGSILLSSNIIYIQWKSMAMIIRSQLVGCWTKIFLSHTNLYIYVNWMVRGKHLRVHYLLSFSYIYKYKIFPFSVKLSLSVSLNLSISMHTRCSICIFFSYPVILKTQWIAISA